MSPLRLPVRVLLAFPRDSYPPALKPNPAPARGGGGIRTDSCLEPEPYAFVHLPMFHTGPSSVGFSMRPLRLVR